MMPDTAPDRPPFPPVATLADLVATVARVDLDRPALVMDGGTVAYGTLARDIVRAAGGLAALGVAHGDRVALLLPNGPEFVVAFCATMRLGAIVVPVNTAYRGEEIAYLLADSGALALVSHAAFAEGVAAALPDAPALRHRIVVGGDIPPGTHAWADLLERAGTCPAVLVAPEDVAVICYTSGTTGRAKGAMLTHRNLVAAQRGWDGVPHLRLRAEDRVLCPLPLFHIYGLNFGMAHALACGATLYLTGRFNPQEALDLVARARITVFLGAPPMYVAFAALPDLGTYDLAALRVCGSGAAPLPVAVLERFRTATGVTIMEGYGLTETAPIGAVNAAGPVVKPGTVGPPFPGVALRLVDERDCDVPPGAEGEVLIQGDCVFAGYWQRPEATAEALRGGWFHTGDIATVDADGYYTLVDRKKDMINNGGLKVWPREVEEVLYRHPAVREAAVVPLPDPYAGERPMAFVTLRAGQQSTEADLIAYVGEHLAKFKVPVRIEFRDELPKLPTGKVLRRVLRDEAQAFAPRPLVPGRAPAD
jgi:acyl-CoA synthetase (AMP-forming)/AMP-acid ligase II